MSDKPKVIVIRGVLNYARVLGEPRKHTGLEKYDKGPYWSVDVTPDAKSMELIEQLDLEDKLRPKKKKDEEKIKADKNRVGTGKFLSFKHLLKRADGGENKPIRVEDARGNAWGDARIGNGSVADVKVKVVDYGSGSDKGTYIQAIRVLDLVPYEDGTAFEPLPEDDEYAPSNALPEHEGGPDGDQFEDKDDLDDDVPF